MTLNTIATTDQTVGIVSELWDDSIGLLARAEGSATVASLQESVAHLNLDDLQPEGHTVTFRGVDYRLPGVVPASTIVETRWATISTVASRVVGLSAARRRASVARSSAENESSNR